MPRSPNDISREMYITRLRAFEIDAELDKLRAEKAGLRIRYTKLCAEMQSVQTNDSSQHSAGYVGQVIGEILDI